MGTFFIVLCSLLGILLLLSFASYMMINREKKRRICQLEAAWGRSQFTADELKADLRFLSEFYKRVHPVPFHSLTEIDFKGAVRSIDEALEEGMGRLDLYRVLAPFISTLNDEHTVIHFPEPELKEMINSKSELFPCQVQFISGKCYVKERAENQSIPSGSEILSINQIPMDQVKEKISQYFSGTREEQRLFYAQNRFSETLYFAYGFRDTFQVEYRSRVGEEKTVVVPGNKYQPEIIVPFSYETQGDILIFHYHAFVDPQKQFREFLQTMFIEAQEKKIKHLIIDLRSNQGGTSSLGDDLLRYLTKEPFCQFTRIELKSSPELKAFFLGFIPDFLRWFIPLPYLHPILRSLWRTRVGKLGEIKFNPVDPGDNPHSFVGQIFVLVGSGSMSSSSLLSAAVKQYQIGKLLGEPTGGFPTHYGNMMEAHLPNTGIKVEIPSSINYGNGEGPVIPDLLIEQTLEDLFSGEDTVMQVAMKRAHSDLIT